MSDHLLEKIENGIATLTMNFRRDDGGAIGSATSIG